VNIESIKDLLTQILKDHPDKESLWDSWARRFCMGIDKTKSSATKALAINSERFTSKSGQESLDYLEGYIIDQTTLNYLPFAVRNHVTKAAISWAVSTISTGNIKEEAEKLADEHMITAESLIDLC
jgi:hypothetical protein